MLPLILNQASAHCLWAAAKSSLQEHPSSMGVPDSWLVISMLRWQILQSLSTLSKCTLTSGTEPSSRSTSTEHSEAEDPLSFSHTPTISVPGSWEELCPSCEWSVASEHPSSAAELRWQQPLLCMSTTTTTWDLSSVVTNILNTQVENLYVMTQWGKDHKYPQVFKEKVSVFLKPSTSCVNCVQGMWSLSSETLTQEDLWERERSGSEEMI